MKFFVTLLRHIKSHLQKYRIQSEKSNEQFIDFFEKHMRIEFYQFLAEYEKTSEVTSSLTGANPYHKWAIESASRFVIPENNDLDQTSGATDASRSDETLSASSAQQIYSNERKKLKAEFDNVYKESLGLKNALTEITARHSCPAVPT